METLSKKATQGYYTREALITVARKQFAIKGYTETSIEEIVEKANVTKGAFYHHFNSKEELFLRVFENVKKEIGRAAFVTHTDRKPFNTTDVRKPRLKWLDAKTNEEVWNELIERCRRYIELHTDPDVRRIALVDARWVLKWEDLQRIESEYGMTMLRAALRRSMRRGILMQMPLKMLSAILAGTLTETSLLIANAKDQKKTLDEAMNVIVSMLNGLRSDNPLSDPKS